MRFSCYIGFGKTGSFCLTAEYVAFVLFRQFNSEYTRLVCYKLTMILLSHTQALKAHDSERDLLSQFLSRLGIVLKKARMTKKGKSDANVGNGALIETLVIRSIDLVQVVAMVCNSFHSSFFSFLFFRINLSNLS